MNSKKGVSMVMAVIIIVVLIVISTTVVITGSSITTKTKLKNFGTEMLQIKEATNQYIKRKSGNIDWDTKKISLTNMPAEQLEQFENEDLTQDLELYVVNLKDIGADTATYGLGFKSLSNDVYLWSKETNEIYYLKGYENDDTIYYTLTDELMELIK